MTKKGNDKEREWQRKGMAKIGNGKDRK